MRSSFRVPAAGWWEIVSALVVGAAAGGMNAKERRTIAGQALVFRSQVALAGRCANV